MLKLENEEEWLVVVVLDFGIIYFGYVFWRKENFLEIIIGKWNIGLNGVLELLKILILLFLN